MLLCINAHLPHIAEYGAIGTGTMLHPEGDVFYCSADVFDCSAKLLQHTAVVFNNLAPLIITIQHPLQNYK